MIEQIFETMIAIVFGVVLVAGLLGVLCLVAEIFLPILLEIIMLAMYIGAAVYGLFALVIGIVCESLVHLLKGEKKFLFVGCLITLIGIGISPTEPGIIFGLGIALIILSSIAIRVQENREFRNLKHDLVIYESMKRKSGMINLWLGVICCIVAIAITGVVAVNIYTIPGLALIGFGAGKVMKYSFIRRSSPGLLSSVIKIKYFYRDTSGLIAKAMNFKMSQRVQRVAA